VSFAGAGVVDCAALDGHVCVSGGGGGGVAGIVTVYAFDPAPRLPAAS
jgi:hypothetical protein